MNFGGRLTLTQQTEIFGTAHPQTPFLTALGFNSKTVRVTRF
jgi:hypothetical protein